MLLEMVTNTVEYKLRSKKLSLAREHAQEWKYIFALEMAARSTLEAEHQQEMKQSLISGDVKQQAATVVR